MKLTSVRDTLTLNNGVQIPCVGFGTWQTPNDIAEDAVRTAIECGYTHIDTAAVYGNEEGVGRGIAASGAKRGDLFITTKVWNDMHGYEETLRAFDDSMKRLGIEYCDLYLIHWPNPAHLRGCWEEKNAGTWKAMEKLVADGRARAIGISNFRKHHIDALMKTANICPAVNQMFLNPAEAQTEVVEYSRKLGMLMEAYSPLGTGRLLNDPVVAETAAVYGKTPAQLLLRWNLQKGFLPLPKSVTAERIRSNMDLFDFEVSDADMAKLDTLHGCLGAINDPDKVDF